MNCAIDNADSPEELVRALAPAEPGSDPTDDTSNVRSLPLRNEHLTIRRVALVWKMLAHRDAVAKVRRRRRRLVSLLLVTKVDPLLWAVALDMVDGDTRRLKVLDAHTVLIVN